MVTKNKQSELIAKLDEELNEIRSLFHSSLDELEKLSKSKSVSFMDLEDKTDNLDGDLSLTLQKLLKLYGTITVLRKKNRESGTASNA